MDTISFLSFSSLSFFRIPTGCNWMFEQGPKGGSCSTSSRLADLYFPELLITFPYSLSFYDLSIVGRETFTPLSNCVVSLLISLIRDDRPIMAASCVIIRSPAGNIRLILFLPLVLRSKKNGNRSRRVIHSSSTSVSLAQLPSIN